MAATKVTFIDKVTLVEQPTVAAINKGRDSDWNELKNSINDNADLQDANTAAIVLNTAKLTNVSTELSNGTIDATTYGITSDGGVDDVVLVEATTALAGLLGAAKWNEIVANSLKDTNVGTDLSLGTVTSTEMDVDSSDGTNATLVEATTLLAGLLGADKWNEIVANSLKVSYTDAAQVATNKTNADASKLITDEITVTQPVDLDTVESDTASNTTHRGLVTGNPHATDFQELPDKDSVPQSPTTVASASGAVVFDMSKQIQDVTLTGNITGITFSNEPAAGVRGSWLIDVYQNATGGYTMAWTGSGVFGADSEVAADFEPLATALGNTQYWLYWNGSDWTIRIVKISITAL